MRVRVRRNFGFGLAERHADYNLMLHRKVLSQDRRLVENYATAESMRLYNMHHAVMRCLQANKGFIRLKTSTHGILYAKVETEHDVVDLLLRHFHRRYPTFHIALEYRGRTYVADRGGDVRVHNLCVEEAVKSLEASMPENKNPTDNITPEKLWCEYYASQLISQRRNLKLMGRMMPVKYRVRAVSYTHLTLPTIYSV